MLRDVRRKRGMGSKGEGEEEVGMMARKEKRERVRGGEDCKGRVREEEREYGESK